MKLSSLDYELEEEYGLLNRLRERIVELRDDIAQSRKEIRIYYAVDFSEIHPYLHLGQEDEDNIIGVTLDAQDFETKFNQYWLALTHLFNTFNETLYLLPPHTLELWNYARGQTHKSHGPETQYRRLLERTRQLEPRHKHLLESLQDVDRKPDLSRELIEFVKSPEFRPLCVDVSEFVTWYKGGTVLKQLFDSHKLSNRIDRILAEYGNSFGELKNPDGHETLQVLRKFSKVKIAERRNQTIIDSRALIFLRNLNFILNESKARVVLITRDITILHAATVLAREEWFGWSDVREHVRGLESIFLDLILQGMPAEEKLIWIRDSEYKLARMQESVHRILGQLKREKPSMSDANRLASLGKKVLLDATLLWNQHINVRLSLALKHVPWLGDGFLASPIPNVPKDFGALRSEYNQLKNLLEFLTTPLYENLAIREVQYFWRDIEVDSLRMAFLDLLGQEGAKRVSKLLSETFKGSEGLRRTVVRSQRFLRMPSVVFVSKQYQDLLKPFRSSTNVSHDKAFLAIVYEAVSGLNEPEDFLFMAFVLGMIDEWEEALKVIEKCRQVTSELPASEVNKVISKHEVDYFEGIIHLRLAEMESDAIKAIHGFIDAFNIIQKAAEARKKDPRYLIDKAGAIMLYHETVKKICIWPVGQGETALDMSDPAMPTPEEARNLYIDALRISDEKQDLGLKIKTLNNLAYWEVLSDSPDFIAANNYIDQIDLILHDNKSGEELNSTLEGVASHFEDTRVMIDARKAKESRDLEALKLSIKRLKALLSERNLSAAEKRIYSSHIGILQNWSELGQKTDE